MANSGTESRNLPASRKKLEDARKKGQVAKSRDMTGAVAFTLGCIYLVVEAPRFLAEFSKLIHAAGDTSGPFPVALDRIGHACIATGIALSLPILAVVVFGAVVSTAIVLKGLPVSFHSVTPNFEAINPVEGFKRLFGLHGLVEFGKTLFKTAVLLAAIVLVLLHGAKILAAIAELAVIPHGFATLMVPILVVAIVLFLVVAIADIVIQNWLFRREMRMGHAEQKRELKDTEGEPMFRRHRRQAAREASYGAGRVGITHATVAITAGNSLFVALRYVPDETPVPLVVVRVRDLAARTMLRQAENNDLPVIENPVVARAIADAAAPGEFIPESTYKPVAAILVRLGKVRR